ncbi:MAG: hypothetical protein OEW19_15885, partial [Acidobacteriota bacterium]|nr:hypothetical protein [Acidobacteriota bacterium]
LLLAAVYHESQADRKAGRAEEAASLITMAARRFPADIEVQLMAAESLLVDQKNPQGAIDMLSALEPPPGNRVLRTRRATLQADAYEAAGQNGAAIAALEAIVAEFPSPRLQQRVDSLKEGAGAPR